jgi:hypothetical protein
LTLTIAPGGGGAGGNDIVGTNGTNGEPTTVIINNNGEQTSLNAIGGKGGTGSSFVAVGGVYLAGYGGDGECGGGAGVGVNILSVDGAGGAGLTRNGISQNGQNPSSAHSTRGTLGGISVLYGFIVGYQLPTSGVGSVGGAGGGYGAGYFVSSAFPWKFPTYVAASGIYGGGGYGGGGLATQQPTASGVWAGGSGAQGSAIITWYY